MQLITYFAQNHRVVFASPAKLGEHREDLTQLGVKEQHIALNCDSFNTWVSELNPATVIFDRFMMEEQFGWRVEQCVPGCLRILDTEDLHSLRQARHDNHKAALKQGIQFDTQFADTERLFAQMSVQDVCQREIAAIYRCDLSLMISEFEIELLNNCFGVPRAQLVHLPFMLEPALQNSPNFTARQHFVSIGNFRHAPNWDATLWLKQQIWPRIRRKLPHAQLHIYGAYPSKKVTDLHSESEGFHVLGWAEDAFDVLKHARVCLAPLRFGAGIKGKFTDAMRCATPSVTTTLGAESMAGEYPWPGALANDCEQLAHQAIALHQDAERWQEASNSCAIILAKRYDRAALTALLDERISACQLDLERHRRQNFTGTMLRHHMHKSTKYMSQWIAAKNTAASD